MALPIAVPIVGGIVALTAIGLRLRATSKSPAAVAAAPAAATLVSSIQQGLANGSVKLSTTGVPFQTVSPQVSPAAIAAGLQDPQTGATAILKTDLITVNNTLLAQTLQSNVQNLPGFQPNENVIMVVSSNGNPVKGTVAGAQADCGTGPILALSQDDRLVLTQSIEIPITAVTGVQPADAAVLEAAAAKLAQGKT